jgi:hypothetical protein
MVRSERICPWVRTTQRRTDLRSFGSDLSVHDALGTGSIPKAMVGSDDDSLLRLDLGLSE